MKSEKRSGSYTTRVSLTDPATWKRIQKRVTPRTKRELDAKVAEVKSRWNRGDVFEPSKAKLSEYLERWPVAIAPSVRESTIERYRRTVKTHITPEIGLIPLAKVAPIHLQDLYTKKLGEGLTANTVRGIHTVLHRAFDQAVKWGDIARNPASSVDAPVAPATETTTRTPDQAMTFLTATANDERGTLWLLALYTGMRRGELLALRWMDVDLERGSVAVRRTLTRGVDGKWTTGELKSAACRCPIALPPVVITALQRLRDNQADRQRELGADWNDSGLVVDRGDGLAYHPNTISQRFDRATRALGLPRLRLHDLQHTSATLMLLNGEHPKVVSERMGHSTVSMTLDRYSHVSMDLQRAVAERLERLLKSE